MITTRIVTDQDEALGLYQQFYSAPTHLFDDMRFRKCFHEAYHYPLYFVTAFKDQAPVGLLPLCHNPEANHYEWWGTSWMEATSIAIAVGVTDSHERTAIKKQLLEQTPRPLVLEGMVKDDDLVEWQREYDAKFLLDLMSYPTWDDYLTLRSGSTRAKLRHKIKMLQDMEVEVKVDSQLLPELFRLNTVRFDSRDGSSFDDPRRRQTYEQMVASDLDTHLVGVYFDQVLRSVFMGVLYQETFVVLNLGIDYAFYPHELGTYHLKTELEYATKLGAKYLDIMAEGTNESKHKTSLRFTSIPLYLITLPTV